MSKQELKCPENEILKVFGEFRIIKKYWFHTNRFSCSVPSVVESRLVLERRFKNLANESYYREAIDNPNDRGQSIEQQRAYQLVEELQAVNNELLTELAK